MSIRPPLAVLVTLAALAFTARAGIADGEGALDVAKARLAARTRGPGGEPADSFVLTGKVSDPGVLGDFDPSTRDLSVSFAGLTVVAAETPRPTLEVAATPDALATLWSALGAPGPAPEVDFASEMIVVVSARIEGPGLYPPVVDVTGARAQNRALRIDWRLAGCEWNLCPLAPAPVTCPTVTPFKVVRVTRSSAVEAVQGATLGVCP